jgi:diaminohydroxyphosphoribosylaminopyrimidine deaminase/5-amino-6-(5-phosphoribosylamino)uracil reductase
MNLRLPLSLKIFNRETLTIIFNNYKSTEEGNLIYHKIDEGNVLQGIMQALYNMNILSVLVEGGRRLLQSLIDRKLWDEARIIKNEDVKIENGIRAPVLSDFRIENKEQYSTDTITYCKNIYTG